MVALAVTARHRRTVRAMSAGSGAGPVQSTGRYLGRPRNSAARRGGHPGLRRRPPRTSAAGGFAGPESGSKRRT